METPSNALNKQKAVETTKRAQALQVVPGHPWLPPVGRRSHDPLDPVDQLGEPPRRSISLNTSSGGAPPKTPMDHTTDGCGSDTGANGDTRPNPQSDLVGCGRPIGRRAGAPYLVTAGCGKPGTAFANPTRCPSSVARTSGVPAEMPPGLPVPGYGAPSEEQQGTPISEEILTNSPSTGKSPTCQSTTEPWIHRITSPALRMLPFSISTPLGPSVVCS
ncbi:UNVERIFIED_CONTAM: hypothetical protein Slati_1322800 [Sesamum latifolium]|uniref:Uncharacterized protein n=1 Tax=Sesamum latifolium TaxID=2727402 RepID=A0AAW2XH07_9LAMI